MTEPPDCAFRTAFAHRPVEEMADRRSFEPGARYAANGRVSTVTSSGQVCRRRYEGCRTGPAGVDEDDEPACDCSCPMGQDGRFCKHAEAVALVATDEIADPGQRAEAVIDVRGYLEGLDHQTWVDLLVELGALKAHWGERRLNEARSIPMAGRRFAPTTPWATRTRAW